MAALLIVLGGGGFTFESKCLLQALAGEAEFVYLIPKWAGVPGVDGLPAGESHEVPMFATVTDNSKMRSVNAFIATYRKARALMRRTPFDLALGVGCSHSVPLFLAARIAGRRTLYIESITRADRLSTTGRLVYGLRLADVFVVQWPELAARFPRAVLGSIL